MAESSTESEDSSAPSGPAIGWHFDTSDPAGTRRIWWNGSAWSASPTPPAPTPPAPAAPSAVSADVFGPTPTQVPPRPPLPTAVLPSPVTSSPSTPAGKDKKRALLIGGAVLAGLIVVASVGALNRDQTTPTIAQDASPSASSSPSSSPTPSPTPSPRFDVTVPEVVGLSVAEARSVIADADLVIKVPHGVTDSAIVTAQSEPAGSTLQNGDSIVVQASVKVAVPDLVGATVSEARIMLEDLDLVLAVPTGAKDVAVIETQSVPAASEVMAKTTITVTLKPERTLAQKNAVAKAQSYLRLMGFSREGLIEQLEYEGFSNADAIFGADNAGADWNAECAEKAKSYLDLMPFSREGLYDQLAYEGFTDAQIQFGLTSVGY